MSRKRKADQATTPETPTAAAEIQTPDAPAAFAEEPITATIVEEPAPESGGKFADKVGQRSFSAAPDPFTIARDTVAGIALFESRQDRQMAIKFGNGRPEDKPSQTIIDRVKASGFRWNQTDRIWAHPVRPESAMATRIAAEQLYQEVLQMLRQEKGIGPSPDVPF